MNATLGEDGWHLLRSKADPTEVSPLDDFANWDWGPPIPPSIQGKCAAVAMPLAVETPNHQIA